LGKALAVIRAAGFVYGGCASPLVKARNITARALLNACKGICALLIGLR